MTDRDLLELIATKVGALTTVVEVLQTDMDAVKENMATRQDIVRLENKMDINHKALFDGYKQTYEKVTTLGKRVDEVNKKIEKQDVEIRVIKGGK